MEAFFVSMRWQAGSIRSTRWSNMACNPAFFILHEQLTTIASGITKDIRSASLKRNAELANAVKHTETIIKDADAALANGVSSNKKELITHRLVGAQEQLLASNPKNESDEYYQEIAFEELDMLIGTLKGATAYKAINTLESLNKTEKKILERVFSVIVNQLGSEADHLIDALIEDFAGNITSFDP